MVAIKLYGQFIFAIFGASGDGNVLNINVGYLDNIINHKCLLKFAKYKTKLNIMVGNPI